LTKEINGGYEYTVILYENGAVYSVGRNDFGQLGLGDKVDRSALNFVESSNVSRIAAGHAHTMYLRLGSAFSFGKNNVNFRSYLFSSKDNWESTIKKIEYFQRLYLVTPIS
jgi:alpha-tubulin suppressor-like RCC1 family protein